MEGRTPPPPPPDRPSQPGATPPAPVAEGVPADPHDRIDGIRAWLAQTDRQLGVRTYALGAAVVLALAAGIVALVLVLGMREDSATDSDVEALRDQVQAVERAASQAAEEDVESVTQRLDELEGRIRALESGQTTTEDQLRVVEDDLDEIRDQITDLESPADGTGGSGPGG